jgi:excisionase family DNA binding protein
MPRRRATDTSPHELPTPRPILPDELWTHKETAAYLRLTEQSLYSMNHEGTGPKSYKVGRQRRYDPADIQAWLASRAS